MEPWCGPKYWARPRCRREPCRRTARQRACAGDHNAGLSQMACRDLDKVTEAAGHGHDTLSASRAARRKRFHCVFGTHHVDGLATFS